VSSFADQVVPLIVGGLAVLIPAAAGAGAAWLKSRAQTWMMVKAAVQTAEEQSASSRRPLSGPAKHKIAIGLLAESQPGLTPQRASKIIEAVLPEVKRKSEAPSPDSPRSG
jgi:hypothetical protein